MQKVVKQIIALGGGGFSGRPDNVLLDEYMLKQTGKDKPKILFSPAAGGDSKEYIDKFYNFYSKLSCIPNHITLSKRKYTEKKLEKILLSQDVIFFGGGSPAFLMKLIRKNHLTPLLRRAWNKGIILSGMSAGAIIWFQQGFKNHEGNIFIPIRCLGFLKGSFCPHYDSSSFLRKNYLDLIRNKLIINGYGVEDDTALHFIGNELKQVITSEKGKLAYNIILQNRKVKEKKLTVKYLSSENAKRIISVNNFG